jgi:hypothetical protein
MKGSMWRWRLEVRRVWVCPVCARREKTGGHVVTRLCTCGTKLEPPVRTWMQLIEEPGKAPRVDEGAGETGA